MNLSEVRHNQQIARAAARRAGINSTLFLRQMRQEASFQDLTSPAGAQGPAQIMPATARGWGVKNVHDPHEAYNAAARAMAKYLKSYGGSWAKALTAYNAGPGAVGGDLPAETRRYISVILKGQDDHQETRHRVAASLGTPGTLDAGKAPRMIPGGTSTDTKGAMLAALMDHRKGMSLIDRYHEQVGTGGFTNTTPTKVKPGKLAEYKPGQAGSIGATASARGQRGKVIVAPGANRAGVNLTPQLRHAISVLAGAWGEPLTIGTGTNHSQMTTSGNVSDHWNGNGADIPASGKTLTRLGRHALVTYGMSPAEAAKARGGIYNLQWRGRRVQVIFNTNDGGNHWNHLHVGLR